MIYRALIAVVVVTLLSGCGPSRPSTGKVSGRVTFDGEPLPDAAVLFMPQAGGRPGSGTTDRDGIYQLTTFVADDGALLGPHAVVITKQDPTAPVNSEGTGATPTAAMPARRSLIPERYGRVDHPQFTAEVVAQDNRIDFDLTTIEK